MHWNTHVTHYLLEISAVEKIQRTVSRLEGEIFSNKKKQSCYQFEKRFVYCVVQCPKTNIGELREIYKPMHVDTLTIWGERGIKRIKKITSALSDLYFTQRGEGHFFAYLVQLCDKSMWPQVKE